MKLNYIEKLKSFRYLSLVELVYNDDKSFMKAKVVKRVMDQLNSNIIAVSIVLNKMNFNILYLLLLINSIKKKNISVSLTINCYNGSLLKLSFLRRAVNQFRILIDEKNDKADFIMSKYAKRLKTKKNSLIFLFNIHSEIENIKKYLPLLDENDYIFNISLDNSLSIKEYWDLSKIVNNKKNVSHQKYFKT
jgi:hypothetical protein